MSRAARTWLFLLAAACLGALLVAAVLQLPTFGASDHPYRDAAVAASTAHATANVVASINFDQRALDTMGEESILVASVVGVGALLRPSDDEERVSPVGELPPLDATRLLGYVLLPVTLVLGVDVVAHGQLTPGGGFQGGIVLATGLHLLYVTGSYPALERVRPVPVFEVAEAAGISAYVALGLAGLAGTGWLADVVPSGRLGALWSSGTAALLNAAVGVAVTSSTVVLLAHFLDQDLAVRPRQEAP